MFRRVNLDEAGRRFGRMYMGDSHDEIAECTAENLARYELQQRRNGCARIIKWLSEKKRDELSKEKIEEYYLILRMFEEPVVEK